MINSFVGNTFLNLFFFCDSQLSEDLNASRLNTKFVVHTLKKTFFSFVLLFFCSVRSHCYFLGPEKI